MADVPTHSQTPDRGTPPVPWWEWLQAALLLAALGWTTYGLGGYRPETMRVSSLLLGALFGVHFLSAAFSSEGQRLHPAGWLLVPFLLYAAANVIWVTPVQWLGWADWMLWVQAIGVFWVALNGIRARAVRSVLFGGIIAIATVAVAFGCYQRFLAPDWLPWGRMQSAQFHGRASGVFGIPNSLAGLLVLLIPATVALAFRRAASPTERIWWSWITVIFIVGLALTISRGAWLALTVALTLWPLSATRWSWRRRGVAAFIVLATVAAGVGALYSNSKVVRERMAVLVLDEGERTRPFLWRAAWQLFLAQPVTGSGAGSFDVLFERHRPERFPDQVEWAHNEYLNTLSDYGGIGFVLLFGAAVTIAVCTARNSAGDEAKRERGWINSLTARRGMAIGLLAFALQLAVDFHFRIPALGMTFAVVAGLVVARAWRVPDSVSRSHVQRSILTAVALAVMFGASRAHEWYRGEAIRRTARESIDRLARLSETAPTYAPILKRARAELERAVSVSPGNGRAWSDLAYAIALQSRLQGGEHPALGRQAEAAAEHALACTQLSYEFWIRRGIARDLQGRWFEAGNDFAQAVKLGPASPLAWYYQAEHLSRKPSAVWLAEGSLTICLRLDPWNEPALALRQRLAISAKAP